MGMILRSIFLSLIFFLVLRAIRQWWAGESNRAAPSPRPPPPQQPATPSPYQVLGVSPQASPEEVRHAYQKLVQQYHPDQVAHLGEELREVAERRTKEINAAYNQLKRS